MAQESNESDTQSKSSHPTPEETLANWETLFAEFRKATPSSPQWYQIADYCIGVLMEERIARLKENA